jgi:replication-associated recombination protein RarA
MPKVTLPPDPWQKIRTLHDIPADEVISGLQKCLRRGLKEKALLIGYEMYMTSAELEEMLWSRLSVISVEDVGGGNPMLPVIVDTLYRTHQRYPRPVGDRFLFAAHAIRLIADSPKDRTTDDMVNYARLENQVRDHAPEIPDFAIDMHTRRGWEMGRGYEHFMTEASRIENVIEDRDTSYRDRIMAAIAAGELS